MTYNSIDYQGICIAFVCLCFFFKKAISYQRKKIYALKLSQLPSFLLITYHGYGTS